MHTKASRTNVSILVIMEINDLGNNNTVSDITSIRVSILIIMEINDLEHVKERTALHYKKFQSLL